MLQIKLIVRVPCLLPFIDGFDEPTMTDRDRFQRPLPWFYTAAAAQLERFVHALTFPIVVHPARRCSSVAVAVAAVGAMG